MTNLVIDRSTDAQSLAWFEDFNAPESVTLDGLDCRSGEWTAKVQHFLSDRRPDRIIVGTGPGSFAGIRAALAFAQGWAIGTGCAVEGLTSAAAFTRPGYRTGVIGDARRGLCWVALFEGYRLERDVFLTPADKLDRLPPDHDYTTPDEKRIGTLLAETFGNLYLGGGTPTAARLAVAAQKSPALLVREPLPIYLNPAVR